MSNAIQRARPVLAATAASLGLAALALALPAVILLAAV